MQMDWFYERIELLLLLLLFATARAEIPTVKDKFEIM